MKYTILFLLVSASIANAGARPGYITPAQAESAWIGWAWALGGLLFMCFLARYAIKKRKEGRRTK